MKKESVLSPRAKSPKLKKDPWKGYDFETLPELTPAQLASFKPVSKETYLKLRATGTRKVGRPVKKPHEREEQILIRFKPAVLKKIKMKAKRTGYTSYQRYIKAVLEKEIR